MHFFTRSEPFEVLLHKAPMRNGAINPIPGGLWNYVARRGGEAIMAQVFSRLHNFAKRPPSTQNLLLDKYCDL